jgi:hypothetical protein
VVAAFVRKLLVVCMLVGATGGQWMVLQSAAWAGMIVSNLRHDSIQVAVSQTFDGQHPCPLCKAIEATKKSDKKSDVEIKLTRMEFPPDNSVFGLVEDDNSQLAIVNCDWFLESLTTAPLLRPPRLIPA